MKSIYLFGIFASIVCFVAGAYAIIIADNFPSTAIGAFSFSSRYWLYSEHQTKCIAFRQRN
jgi:hypothetical protein